MPRKTRRSNKEWIQIFWHLAPNMPQPFTSLQLLHAIRKVGQEKETKEIAHKAVSDKLSREGKRGRFKNNIPGGQQWCFVRRPEDLYDTKIPEANSEPQPELMPVEKPMLTADDIKNRIDRKQAGSLQVSKYADLEKRVETLESCLQVLVDELL